MPMVDPKGSSTSPKYSTDIRLAWDKQGLYGLFTMKHSPILANPEKWVFLNDNFEFFLSPGLKKEVKFQFAFDALNRKFLGTQRLLPIINMDHYKPFLL